MPISPNTEMKTPEKKDWPVIPEDVYQVEITDIAEDVSEYQGQKKDVFKFEFTLIEPGAHYGRKLWKRGTRVSPIPFTNGKNPLTWKVASAVAKHPLTEAEGKAYRIEDMNAMIGKQIRINVSITPPKEDGKQFNNVESFLAAKQQLPPFDESKVKKDESTKPAAPTPADIVAKASGGKFAPHSTAPSDEDMEFGENEPDDIPFG